MPTPIPTIPQINDAKTRIFAHIIKAELFFPVMPIISRSSVPKPDKMHAVRMKARVTINFKHCPSKKLGTPEHVKGAV